MPTRQAVEICCLAFQQHKEASCLAPDRDTIGDFSLAHISDRSPCKLHSFKEKSNIYRIKVSRKCLVQFNKQTYWPSYLCLYMPAFFLADAYTFFFSMKHVDHHEMSQLYASCDLQNLRILGIETPSEFVFIEIK